MAYQVVKTIKGKQYLYLQSTYREGDKVKTISHYVGAVNSSTGVLTKPSDNPDHPRPHDTADQVEQVLAENGQHFDPLRPEETIEKIRQVLKSSSAKASQATEQGKAVVSERLETKARRADSNQEKPSTPPKPISQKTPTDKSASRLTFKLRSNCKISITGLQKEYQKLLQALKKYGIEAEKFPPVTVKDPQKIGLVEYGKRQDWKDEYACVMAAIEKQGIKELSQKAHIEIAKANKGQRETLKKRTIFFLRRRKTVKRLQARIDANKELIKKLNLIKQYDLN